MTDPSSRATILAVDDTPDNLTLLSELLRQDFRLLLAKSGAAALDLVARSVPPPSLILLDIMMPEMDGYQTLARLRKIPGCEEIPVIYISALDDVKSKVHGLAAGAADFITKPFEPDEVVARVRTQLALVEATRMKADVERIMRHDLKSPIHAILATAQFELENDETDPGVRESFQVVADSANLLLDLVNLSLDLFKIEQGTFELVPEAVDLNALLREQRHQLESLLSAADLTWHWLDGQPDDSTERWIAGDSLLCKSLLGNLLRNAVEASPRGGGVLVQLRGDSGSWGLAIRNPGEIPAALRGRLFQKYATAGKISGTGLGLYSARLIANALSCTLEADVSEPGYTTFRLQFASTTKE